MDSHPTPNSRDDTADTWRDGPAEVERLNGAFQIRHAVTEMIWVALYFCFHTGEILPELCLHCTTVGRPSEEPVLILHGTAGSSSGLLARGFAGELFGPAKALDSNKYFIIMPDDCQWRSEI